MQELGMDGWAGVAEALNVIVNIEPLRQAICSTVRPCRVIAWAQVILGSNQVTVSIADCQVLPHHVDGHTAFKIILEKVVPN